MRKILLVLMFMLSLQQACSAADIYASTFDGVDTYLQDDTIKAEIRVVPGSEIAMATIMYKTVDVFTQEKLNEIRYIYLDQKIDHTQASYTVLFKYNRLTNEIISSSIVITRESLDICSANNETLHKLGKKIYNRYDNQYEIEYALYLEADKFVRDNWRNRDVVKMYKYVPKN